MTPTSTHVHLLTEVVRTLNIGISSEYGSVAIPEGCGPGTRPWRVRLTLGRRQMTVPFYQGPAHTREPTAADVLSCLALDARCGEGDFAGFCDDMGYDQDSRKAEKLYQSCVETSKRLRKFLGPHYDTVANAEH
jgi:hypothetical protein